MLLLSFEYEIQCPGSPVGGLVPNRWSCFEKLKKKMGVCRSKWENDNQENCLWCVFHLLSSFSSSILFFYLSPILSVSSPPGPFSFSLPSNNQEVRELDLTVYSCHYDVILRQGMVN